MSDSIEDQRAGSLRSQAVSEIRSRIQRREIAPEYVLSEAVLCTELGMSRAPVREALIVLAGAGWLDPLPRAGWQVRAMTLHEARDLLAVRAALLPLATAAAARRAPLNEQVASSLRDHLELERSVSSVDDQVVSTYRSLRRIARASGNPEFDRCLEDVLARLVRYYLLEPVSAALRTQPLSLATIIEAVLDGSVDGAREATERYLAVDADRVTGAIIDSELIQSMKLAPAGPADRGGSTRVVNG